MLWVWRLNSLSNMEDVGVWSFNRQDRQTCARPVFNTPDYKGCQQPHAFSGSALPRVPAVYKNSRLWVAAPPSSGVGAATAQTGLIMITHKGKANS